MVEHEKQIGVLEQTLHAVQDEKKAAVETAKLEAEEASLIARAETDHLQMLNHKYKTDLDSLLEFKSRKVGIGICCVTTVFCHFERLFVHNNFFLWLWTLNKLSQV